MPVHSGEIIGLGLFHSISAPHRNARSLLIGLYCTNLGGKDPISPGAKQFVPTVITVVIGYCPFWVVRVSTPFTIST
jgi:hypothetical protein